jgi:DNA-binding transcriptional ArsR family regulator
MPFELSLRYSTPLTPVTDFDEVLIEFLRLVGYLPPADDWRAGDGPVGESIAYRLVKDCLLRDPARAWYAEELAVVLGTPKSSVYRHINKLKSLDLLEEVGGAQDGKGRKGYRIRYGNLARAWDFTEANAQNALKRYRETVNHVQTLAERWSSAQLTAPAPTPAPAAKPAKAKGGSR